MVKYKQEIKAGDEGRDVVAVKDGMRRMHTKGAGRLGKSKNAGPEFVHLIKDVQANHHQHADGVYGPKTHAIIAPHFSLFDRWRYRTAKIRHHHHNEPSKNAGGFLPEGVSFDLHRRDQGRDIQTGVGQKIIAPGAGEVVRVGYDPGNDGGHFGPSYPVVLFFNGPYAGREVYLGHTVSALREGQKFGVNDTLSHTQREGPINGGAPDGWAEIGYAYGGIPGVFGQPTPF